MVLEEPRRCPSVSEAESLLRRLFARNGYVRRPNLARRRSETSDVYKKGFEVRLVVESTAEAEGVRRALASVGLRPGKAFLKARKRVYPVYGKAAVDWFEGR